MIPFDHHTHHRRCGHAVGEIEEYIQAALALGMEEIGITDHAPLYWRDGDHPQPGTAMAKGELERYVSEVLELRSHYEGRIRVLLGLESDYAEGFEEIYRQIREAYPWDYWIGSVHYVADRHIYDGTRWREAVDPEPVYAAYYRLVRKSAESGLFDILGHPSGIMAYGPQPSAKFLDSEFELTANVIARNGVAVEINTSGIRKGTGAPFPHAGLLTRCIQQGVPITYGSDSHLPSEVGHERELAAGLFTGARLWRDTRKLPRT